MDRRSFIKGSSVLLGLASLLSLYHVQASTGTHWAQLLKKTDYSKKRPLRILYPKGCLANLKPIIAEFEKTTGVGVEVTEAGFATISNDMLKSNLLGEANELFDIAIPPTFAIPELADAGVIANLTPLVDKYGFEYGRHSLYRHGDNYQNQLYGFQSSGDVYLLFLRKSWLLDPENQQRYSDQYGYPLAIPRSWEELDRQMSFFHDPDKGNYGGCMFRSKLYMHWEYWIRFHGQGSYPFSRDMEPLVTNEAAMLALQQMKEASTYLHPSSVKNGPYENFALFGEGNCYANLSWGGGQKYFQSSASKVKDDLIITQTPGIKLNNSGMPISYFNWGWSYVLAANGKNEDLAFLFILLASSFEVSNTGVAQPEGFLDPFLENHFSDEQIIKVYGKPFLEALQVGLANAIPDLYMPGYALYFSALRNALNASLHQNVPAPLALQAVADKWRATTESRDAAMQTQQWRHLQKRYPTELQAVLDGF